jgi:hypothetical protein
MGEAKRRAERRREKREAEQPRTAITGQDYAPFFVRDSVNEELKIEFAFFRKRHPEMNVTIRDYMAALLEASVERERQAREAEETKGNLVQPVAVMPAGIEEASKRLQAIKEGAA